LASRNEVLRLKQSEQEGEKQLWHELVAARDNLLVQQLEAANTRSRLDLLSTELQHAKGDLAKMEAVKDAAARAEHSAQEAEVAAQGAELRQMLAARDCEKELQSRAEASAERCLELRKEMAVMHRSMIGATQGCKQYEDALAGKLGRAWDCEREGLIGQIETLQLSHRLDAEKIDGLTLELQRQREDFAAAEEGWWSWLRSVRSRLPPPVAMSCPPPPSDCGLRGAGEALLRAGQHDTGEARTTQNSALAARPLSGLTVDDQPPSH